MFKGELINRAPAPNKEVAVKRLLKGFRGEDLLVDEEIKVRAFSGDWFCGLMDIHIMGLTGLQNDG